MIDLSQFDGHSVEKWSIRIIDKMKHKSGKHFMLKIGNKECGVFKETDARLISAAPDLLALVQRQAEVIKEAFAICSNAIYFDDNSDFGTALYQACDMLIPGRQAGDCYINDPAKLEGANDE